MLLASFLAFSCYKYHCQQNQSETKMKEDKQSHLLHYYHQHHPFRRDVFSFSGNIFVRVTLYLLVLALTYALGYLSALSRTKPDSPSPNLNYTPSTSKTTITTNLLSESDLFRFPSRCSNPVPSNLVRQTILKLVFNNTSPYVNFPPAHVSSLIRKKRVKGWGSTGAVFENLIRKVKPRIIIEVGTFLGASAIHMAELATQLGLETQILCIDDFRGWPGFRDRFKDISMVNGDVMLYHQFMQNVVYFNATKSILPIPFSTGPTLEKLCESGVFGDLIEVDAGHDFHSAWTDINRAYKILRPGGVMFGHDYFTAADERGVRRAVNLFAQVKGFKVRVDGQHWVIDSA